MRLTSPVRGINRFCARANDPFCDPEVIKKQMIIAGEHVYVLLDYAHFRLIGDKPHFLIIPKEHRSTFKELTEGEYLESMAFARKIARYFKAQDAANTLHLFHKNGERAGQTIPHWHLHLIVMKESNSATVQNGLIDISSVRSTGLSSPYYRAADGIEVFYNSARNFIALLIPRSIKSEDNLEKEVEYWREKLK